MRKFRWHVQWPGSLHLEGCVVIFHISLIDILSIWCTTNIEIMWQDLNNDKARPLTRARWTTRVWMFQGLNSLNTKNGEYKYHHFWSYSWLANIMYMVLQWITHGSLHGDPNTWIDGWLSYNQIFRLFSSWNFATVNWIITCSSVLVYLFAAIFVQHNLQNASVGKVVTNYSETQLCYCFYYPAPSLPWWLVYGELI